MRTVMNRAENRRASWLGVWFTHFGLVLCKEAKRVVGALVSILWLQAALISCRVAQKFLYFWPQHMDLQKWTRTIFWGKELFFSFNIFFTLTSLLLTSKSSRQSLLWPKPTDDYTVWVRTKWCKFHHVNVFLEFKLIFHTIWLKQVAVTVSDEGFTTLSLSPVYLCLEASVLKFASIHNKVSTQFNSAFPCAIDLLQRNWFLLQGTLLLTFKEKLVSTESLKFACIVRIAIRVLSIVKGKRLLGSEFWDTLKKAERNVLIPISLGKSVGRRRMEKGIL